MGERVISIKHLHLADEIFEFSNTQTRHPLSDFLCDKEEKVDDMFWLACETFTQYRILGCNANRACIEMTLTHHNTSCSNKRRR